VTDLTESYAEPDNLNSFLLSTHQGSFAEEGLSRARSGYAAVVKTRASMIDLTEYELELLRDGGEFILYLARQSSNPVPVLVLVAERPTSASLKRLEHEYALAADLDPKWAARPLALARHNGNMALVLEDSGNDPLDLSLNRPLELTRFLRVAIGLATVLGQVHRHGLIHKDIKPANVLVDASGNVRLTGFGIASRVTREHQAPAPPEVIAGTLAYMAPEQTGRMNRSIDARSDLYSLGVTLYEMLAGTLPFTASDPMEWVHCHIARLPIPPGDGPTAVPVQLSSIVMKLLAKTAEERYQTAAGLAADLRRCQAEWEAYGRIAPPFPLGTQDASDRLLMPERLYGREREIEALLACFDRVVANGTPELVLVCGYSGIGKSSVVNELHKVLVPPRGLFASGKFDQYKRDIPYAALGQAFQGLVRSLLGQSEAALGRWRDALGEALGPNGQLIMNLVPELELVVGKQPPVADLPPQDAKNRFQMVFRRFLGVFARQEHPLALFFDDLQWLDTPTLDLLEHLVTHSEVRHLLLVGAYRDNEVGPAHPLPRTLEAIRKTDARVHEILLAPLELDDVGRLVADALHCAPERARPLAQLVQEKTGGNPFFAIQFFTALAEEGLIAFDPGTAAWTWDLPRIRAKGFTDNVADLMAAKLSRLPDRTQEALGQLACLGNVAEIATLTLVYGGSEEAIHSALWEAVRTGFVRRLDGAYTFHHDRVQEAAHALIAEGERATAHLRIGRLLASRTASEELEENVFDIVNQFDRCTALITTQEEREQVAELYLIAGKRAKAATAYASALPYLAAGRALLAEDGWERCHALTFALELNWAECEYLTGDLASAEERLSTLSRRAQTAIDSAAVTFVRVNLYTNLDRSDRAVEVGLEYLGRVGIQWALHATEDDVRQDYEGLWRQLAGRSIEALVDLPPMTDPNWCATMDVLTAIAVPCYFTDETIFHRAVVRMVTLSLEHGNSDGSCLAYAWLGGILGRHFGDYETGFRFGRLGVDLVEEHGLDRFSARVYLVFAVHVACWTQHLSTCRIFLRRAFEAAQEAGDLSFAAYSCLHLIKNRLAAGDPLDEVQREAEKGLKFARNMQFGLVVNIITGILTLIRDLRGQTLDLASPNDAEFDEGHFEQHLEDNPRLAMAACWYRVHKQQAHFYAGDYASAIAVTLKVAPLLWTARAEFQLVECHFYGALARAAGCDVTSAEGQAQHVEAVAAHHKQLAHWAKNCPENFGSCAALVGAEIARLEGRELDAERLYEESIRLAREHGFIQNEGVANEFAARFYANRGFETIANTYLGDARHCYLRWGAEGKVRQLDQCHPRLRGHSTLPTPTATFGASVERLDFGTMLKALQALSSEIVLGTLIETLMRIAVEHAGAERGILILLRNGESQIAAEATTSRGKVGVTFRQEAVSRFDLPESALHYVIRTRESVILDDASIGNLFSDDDYVQQCHPKSVLCLPILKQAKLVGALYLENNLTPRAFTPERITVLEFLASQAAISLENAGLYSNLQRSEAFLAEGQRMSRAGSWGWNVSTGKLVWSEEHYRIFGCDPSEESGPTFELFLERVHSEDRSFVQKGVEAAIRDKVGFAFDFRIALPDGSIKYLHGVGRPIVEESGDIDEYIGTTMDVSEGKRGEDALRDAQADLARAARLATMGELTTSIAHEVSQPLMAIVTNADTCLFWLTSANPNLDEARLAAERVVRNGHRAGGIIKSIRSLARKSEPEMAQFDINDAIGEILVLLRGEVRRHNVSLETALSDSLGPIIGDRVQLQQVILNLVMNGIEAMGAVVHRPRMLRVISELHQSGDVLVAVTDVGMGLDPAKMDRIFDAFFTTKLEGMGMGLAICRSIVEAHGGLLWASPHLPHGSVFQFTVSAGVNSTGSGHAA
jgi:predicted ATPase/signal transduction histidine kinase/GAF domain-containing protein